MKIGVQEVKKIARLARLEIAEGDLEEYSKDLSSILEYFEKLNKVKTDKVEPTYNITGLENCMREDKIEKYGDYHSLVKAAPKSEGNLIKTKPVF